MEQLLNRALEFRSNGLRLVRDVQSWHFKCLIIWLVNTRQHLDHGSLTCSVLAEHDDDLRCVEDAFFNVEFEFSESFGHGWVRVVKVLQTLLFLDLLCSQLAFVFLAILFGRDAEG